MTTTAGSFYIYRKGKAHGPCSLDELRTYLAYGSLKPDELVAEAGTDQWIPAKQIFVKPATEVIDLREELPTTPWAWLSLRWRQWNHPTEQDELKAALKTRRRVIRYRDWEKVPLSIRSSQVLKQMILGFCFFPPTFWLACSRVFSAKVIRHAADEDGYLKCWPKAMQTVCTMLIVLNAAAWTWGSYAAIQRVGPLASEASAVFTESASQFVKDVVEGNTR